MNLVKKYTYSCSEIKIKNIIELAETQRQLKNTVYGINRYGLQIPSLAPKKKASSSSRLKPILTTIKAAKSIYLPLSCNQATNLFIDFSTSKG